jgi:mRNA interferase MazF
VIQTNPFNESRIRTVIVVAITSHVRLASAPGNVLCRSSDTGLTKDSVANVSQVLTVDKSLLTERIRAVSGRVLAQIEDGLRMVLDL